MLVWNTRKGYTDSFFILLGISFLFIAGFDLIHTLAYKGMGVIPGDNADLPTQLWIAARYFQSLAFFIATFLIGRSITKEGKHDATILFAMCTSIAILFLSSIFIWPIFPHAFIEGSGLTPFKIGSEYIISVILVATIAMLYLKRDYFDCTVWKFMVAAQVFLIAGELTFTSYISVYGFMNMLGHLFRLISVYFFYRAIVVVGLLRPYDLLLRELNQDREILKKNDAESRAILTAAEESIYLFSADGTILQINETAAGRLGQRTPGEITGHHFSEFINPELARSRRARLDEVIMSKKPLRFEDERSGIIFHHTFYPVPDNTGTVTRIAIFSRDITERKRTEQKLRESEARSQARSEELALLMDSVPAAIWIAHDPLGQHITGNALSYEWLRIPYGSEASKSAMEGVKPETFRMFKDGRELQPSEMPVQQSAGGKEIRNFEFDFVYPEGTVRNVLGNSSPLIDQYNNPKGSVSSYIDITERKRAEEALIGKNAELHALNEELNAIQEELQQNLEVLIEHEHELSINEKKLKEALAEKEVLLSEIHHRVKNNLTAFISLLSLEGSTEDTPAGKMLKQDLQNRARSMALIHEILYKTHLYDEVDMGLYLTTLISQIAQTFRTTRPVKIVIEAHGIMLDIPRATPVGLIINELVTNSFKYAFPGSFDSQAVRNAPPAITIILTKNDEEYELIVKDNGIGLPPGFDRTKTQTLGLKLVNFLASHQLRATITAGNAMGAEFRFTFSGMGK
jgi:PAS domain S-box-containing protein